MLPTLNWEWNYRIISEAAALEELCYFGYRLRKVPPSACVCLLSWAIEVSYYHCCDTGDTGPDS